MVWPLTRVWVMLGLVPRRLTRSFSSKPPSLALAELMLTPGRRCSVSATFFTGSLPMSSAVTTSMCEFASFFSASEAASVARMPVTVTDGSSVTFFLAAALFWALPWLFGFCVLSCAYAPTDRHRPATMLAASSVLRWFMMSSPQRLDRSGTGLSWWWLACLTAFGAVSLERWHGLISLPLVQKPAGGADDT